MCVCVFELCVCACVSSTVLLVSGFRDGAMCRNGPLRCLAGRPDPSRSTSITTWNLNVKHGPLLQPFVFLCGSVGLDTRKAAQKNNHLPFPDWSDVDMDIFCNTEMPRVPDLQRVLKDECIATFFPTSLKLSALLTDWQLEWTQLLVNSCLYLAYLWVDWLILVDGHKVSLQTKNLPSLGFKCAVINLLVFLDSLFCLWHF